MDMMQKYLKTALLPIIVGMLVAAPSEAADSDSTDTATEFFVIETIHRLYPEFSQTDTVGFAEPFSIGEEEWQASIILFNPHLGITTDGDALQMSDTLYNPAVRVRVEKGDSLIQESWGFHYVDSPHFYRDQMLGFKLIEFQVGEEYPWPSNQNR